MSKNQSSGLKCPRCAKNSLLNDDETGERFCDKCGYVISESQESDQEWRSFSQDEYGNKTRMKTSLTIPDVGLSTIINPQNRDATGKPLTSAMKSTIKRLRTLDNRSKNNSSIDKNLAHALIEMNKLKNKLTLSDAVVENTMRVFQKALEKKLAIGYSINGLIGACLYASCRNTETPRTLNDVAKGINIKRKDISRCYKLIIRELELTITISDPIKHVFRIASIVGLSEKSKRKAITILEEVKKTSINVGKEPMGIIAGALYLACIRTGEEKTQKDIAIASGVTEKTIRERCKELTKIG
jgi:transcription initiation factor TFIIB